MPTSGSPRTAHVRNLRLPRSHWDDVWAAWCPTCRQEAMPLTTGCCGFCDTNLAGQVTRGPYDDPLTADAADGGPTRLLANPSIAIAA